MRITTTILLAAFSVCTWTITLYAANDQQEINKARVEEIKQDRQELNAERKALHDEQKELKNDFQNQRGRSSDNSARGGQGGGRSQGNGK